MAHVHHHHTHDLTTGSELHGSHGSFEEENKKFFDNPANEHLFNADAHERADLVTAAMLEVYSFDKEKTVVMDFACGTGLISQALAAHAQAIVGVDISQHMVDLYNRHAQQQGPPQDKMRAICVPGLKEKQEELEGMSFDAIVCASSYHHFSSIIDVTKILVSYLKPGGSLLVADMIKTDYPEEILPLEARHMVAHMKGFDEQDMRFAFESAGLGNFSYKGGFTHLFRGHPMTLFLAKGDKELSLEHA